jgi:D-sedoheptulose 7-phosphate isomerase
VLEALAPHITIDAVRRRIVAQLVARQRARDTTVTGAGYLEQVAALIGEISVDRVYRFAELIWKAHGRGRALFAFGNGGSSATAAHFMEDVGKGIEPEARLGRFRALALCESVSLITAWANDSDFADVFAEPLRNFVREGDIVIGISGSGNSENVVRALEVANDRGALTLALTGYDGGRLRNVAREAIVVPSNSMQQIEDVHLVICHQIYIFLKELAETRPASRGRAAASARTRR